MSTCGPLTASWPARRTPRRPSSRCSTGTTMPSTSGATQSRASGCGGSSAPTRTARTPRGPSCSTDVAGIPSCSSVSIRPGPDLSAHPKPGCVPYLVVLQPSSWSDGVPSMLCHFGVAHGAPSVRFRCSARPQPAALPVAAPDGVSGPHPLGNVWERVGTVWRLERVGAEWGGSDVCGGAVWRLKMWERAVWSV